MMSGKGDERMCGKLRKAISNGDLAAARRLIKGGVNVNATYWYEGTLLQEAVQSNSKEAVSLLLQYKADVNAANQDGRTAMHIAARFGDKGMVELLLAAGGDVDIQTMDGRTPLHVALWRGHEVVVPLLCNERNVNMQDQDGWSSLHWVANKNLKDSLDVIISMGAKMNLRNRVGKTALHESIVKGHYSIMRSLIHYGADVNIDSRTGGSLRLLSQRDDFLADDISLLLATASRSSNKLPGHIPKNFMKSGQIAQMVSNFLTSVQPLGDLCRNCIRRILNDCHGGRALKPFVSKLPLPLVVQNYLLLKEEIKDNG